jgi:hypothetical protein
MKELGYKERWLQMLLLLKEEFAWQTEVKEDLRRRKSQASDSHVKM